MKKFKFQRTLKRKIELDKEKSFVLRCNYLIKKLIATKYQELREWEIDVCWTNELPPVLQKKSPKEKIWIMAAFMLSLGGRKDNYYKYSVIILNSTLKNLLFSLSKKTILEDLEHELVHILTGRVDGDIEFQYELKTRGLPNDIDSESEYETLTVPYLFNFEKELLK